MLRVGKPLESMDLMEMSRIRIWPFLWRTLLYATLVAGLVIWIVRAEGWVQSPAIILLGLLYAHGVELQHQALHNTGFPSRFWNRAVGFLLGLPMLVSFSDYQYNHLNHHRDLGTDNDREFFNYDYDRLTDLKPLLAHLMMLSHYRDVSGFIARSIFGWTKPNVKRESAVKIRTEYILMAVCLAAAVGVSIAFRTTLFVEIWLLPLVVAIPTHALIELPEHWGQDHDTLDVLQNTRTIRASRLASWFTNGNHFHVEHHWLPSIPNDRFADLHAEVSESLQGRIVTYPQFYKTFLSDLYQNTFSRGERAEAPLRD